MDAAIGVGLVFYQSIARPRRMVDLAPVKHDGRAPFAAIGTSISEFYRSYCTAVTRQIDLPAIIRADRWPTTEHVAVFKINSSSPASR
jgi:hypothetical protein